MQIHVNRGMGETSGASGSLAQMSQVLTEVPMSPGTTPAVAQASCVAANGTWDSTNNACALPTYPTLPWYCNYGGTALGLSDCQLPTATDLQNMGAYTAYQIGMQNNDPSQTAALMADNLSSSEDSIANNTDCSYTAAQNYPLTSQVLGPDLTCALSNPFSTYGWMIYAALGFIAYKMATK